MSGKKHSVLLVVMALSAVAVFFLHLLLGTVDMGLTDIAAYFTGGTQDWKSLIIEARLAQAIAASMAGSALAVSGLQMQTMFRNPVAGPFVLGISSGASLGVAVLLLLSSAAGIQLLGSESAIAAWGLIVAAGIGAALIFLLNFFIALRVADAVAMLIIGLMIGGGISALIEILQSLAARDALRNYILWTFGSFNNVTLAQCAVMTVPVILGLLLSFGLSKSLDVLLLGDTYAQTSGLHLQRTKALLVISTSLLAGGVTAFCGPIGFVDLAVPHIARYVFRSANHFVLNTGCVLIGAAVCGACNIIASVPGSELALPVNAVTSLLGAPFVIWLIVKRKRI